MSGLSDAELARRGKEMVRFQLRARGISDRRVLEAMSRVRRHEFVPPDWLDQAYADRPLPIGPLQTISQPFVVALMLQELRIQPNDKALEIGAGSGYVSALLSVLCREVYAVELEADLARSAAERLERLGFLNVKLRCGDGKEGWSEFAPFACIIVSAACSEIPRELTRQLTPGGRMVLPLGDSLQYLVSCEKSPQGLKSRDLGAVQFVPLR